MSIEDFSLEQLEEIAECADKQERFAKRKRKVMNRLEKAGIISDESDPEGYGAPRYILTKYGKEYLKELANERDRDL